MRDIIVFGEDFGGLPSSTQHLITGLCKNYRVLWVNSIGLRQPRLCKKDLARVFRKLFGSKGTVKFSDDAFSSNIITVNLRTIPAPQSVVVRWFAKTLMVWQLKLLFRHHKISNPILWTSLPTAADLCGSLGERSVVYYCGDDFSSLAGVDHKVVEQHERKLVEKSDVIFAASDKLLQKFPSHKTYLMPHGVDYDLFATPTYRATDLPNNARPTAGFYGSLSEWLDYDLLKSLCLAKPEWNFVFVGPLELSSFPLDDLPNVYRLGPKPHSTLPSYIQHWDISLLPFINNEQIKNCSPLKLMEYLSSGTPVLASRFNAVEPLSHVINIYDNADEAITVFETLSNKKEQQQAVAKQHRWSSRVNLLRGYLEAL
ncbi:glycosyltransferase family protein [Vibrio sonorensis]|uniref:glycosyltransferase family protein n=1 Tax=Vibrio sonorensis TaxID=1004316 RepID=UPI0008DA076A|nr:glycosyltransferase family 1 protein [Vibrio sonorensis]